MTSSRADAVDRLGALAARVAASHGLEIFDVQLRREPVGWVLRVIIDRPADLPPSSVNTEPVGIEDCQRVSQDLSALLDVEDDLTGGLERYTLEVSSPGLDRPLRHEADYRRFIGRLAKVVTRAPVDGQSHFAGRIASVEADQVLLIEGGRTHRIPLAMIRRGRLDIEF